jgi:hypothetical protein
VPAITEKPAQAGYGVVDMVSAKSLPDLHVQVKYETWIQDVWDVLAKLDIEAATWQKNWEFEFRKEYDCGSTPYEAAARAQDFWWQQLLAESWT